MTATELAIVADDRLFQGRVEHYLVKEALSAMAEDPATAEHAARLAYARKILCNTANVRIYACVVLANATIAAAASPDAILDSDIEYVVVFEYTKMSTVNS